MLNIDNKFLKRFIFMASLIAYLSYKKHGASLSLSSGISIVPLKLLSLLLEDVWVFFYFQFATFHSQFWFQLRFLRKTHFYQILKIWWLEWYKENLPSILPPLGLFLSIRRQKHPKKGSFLQCNLNAYFL